MAIQQILDIFANVFQKCFVEEIFRHTWKKQKLVPIPKPSKHPGESSSYHPIWQLDTMGKIRSVVDIGKDAKDGEYYAVYTLDVRNARYGSG